MRLLITGALGHIGSRLIRSLSPGEFDEVVLLDNLSTQRYCSLFDLPRGIRYRFVEADVCTTDFDRLLNGVDTVIHLAAITNAVASFGDEERVERVNLKGTERIAEACARHGCRLFFPSTTSVYGTQSETVDETCPRDELRPQSPYADSKLRAEELLARLGADRSLRYLVGRLGTIYDTSIGMRFHTAINKFCWQASIGQPLTVWRTAMDQHRPYLDLDDAVRAMMFVTGRDLFENRVYNVVTENATVRQVIDVIREEVSDVIVDYVDSPIMNQLSYSVSADRFRERGFKFSGNLRSGVMRTLALLQGLRQSGQRLDQPADSK